MTSATDVLRRMLDERGVEWETDRSGFRVMWGKPVDEFHDTMQFKAVDNALPNGGLNVHICGFTPEQAIAATLGSCNCSNNCTNSERTEACLPHFWMHDGTLHIEATRTPTRIVVCEGGTCEFVPKRELDASEAENAKLRELVWDLYCLAYPSAVEWEVSDETYDKYSPCEKCKELHGGKSPCASTAKDMTEECCAPIQANVVADRMRELGVEVDE